MIAVVLRPARPSTPGTGSSRERGHFIRYQRLVAASVLTLSLCSAASGQDRGNDTATILELRAERPADLAADSRQAHLVGVHPGNLLFQMTGPDNAPCVRSIPDVTADGRDEILVGIDESGTDNIFCLDGASTGTATVVWSIETADGLSGGAPWGDQSVEPASDADGNGHSDLLVGTSWGGRTAYRLDGLDGATQWKFDTYLTPDSGWVYSLAELNDITGDGVPEAAFGTGSFSDAVYLIDGASGTPGQATVVWRYQATDAVTSVRDLGDANNDGKHDVLAAVSDSGREVICLDGGSALPGGQTLWRRPTGATAYAVGVLTDITGDGVAEALAAVWTLDGSAIRAYNGATGVLVWASTDVADYGVMVDILQDVTGDSVPEVVVSSFDNAVAVLSGADGSRIWRTAVGTLNGGDVWSARAIDDLNGDGRQDVVAGSFDYHVYALDGDDGQVLWAYNTNNRVFSVYPVGDLNGDGRPEVVAGTQDTTTSIVVHVLEGDAGMDHILFVDGFETGDTSAWTTTAL